MSKTQWLNNKYKNIVNYDLLNERYNVGLQKFDLHMEQMNNCEPYQYPGCEDGKYKKSSSLYDLNNWMTSFVTGLAPLYYKSTKNEKYLKWANGFGKYYHSKMFDTPMDSMHDIGFLYSPYSVAMYKLTGDEVHKKDALKAADELAKRFSITGGYIDAWERMDNEERPGRAIIDWMMNIPLLLWAWKETGHPFYRDIALSHAELTKKLFIRDDFSVVHSFIFDKKTGEVIGEANKCGFDNGSWWARGTAWAVYGFAILARYMDSDEYRKLATNIAKAYISQFPENSFVPIWDFRLPEDLPAKKCGNVPADWDETRRENCEFNVDTSAAAIMACGLMCLYRQTDEEWMLKFAIESIEELSADKYINCKTDVLGILSHQNGQMHYTTYGDYFFIEALSMILYNEDGCW